MPSCKLQDFVCGHVQIARCTSPLPHPGSTGIPENVSNAFHLCLGTKPALGRSPKRMSSANMKWNLLTPTESHPVIRVLCELSLASLICLAALVALAGLLMGHRKNLKRLRGESRQLATKLPEPHGGEPHIGTSPRSHRGSDDREAVQGAAEGSGSPGSLDSYSWQSNRLCG